MRLILVTFALLLLPLGCGQRVRPKEASSGAAQVQKSPAKAKQVAPAKAKAKPAPAEPKAKYPVVTPLETPIGRVASVNPRLRFVVLDFSLSPLPAVDQKLFVYRHGQKVAELNVTGPFRGSNVGADIVAGEAQEGDETREK